MASGIRERPLGRTGIAVPAIGQGTWEMEKDRHGSIAALGRGIELGMTHIDTAEMYGSGEVERIVGEAIRGVRERVFLASKVLPDNASREGTIRACERSLERLRTDRLDLYMLHWAGSHPLEETVAAFEALRAAGKIRAWGVSNFDEKLLEKTMKLAPADSIAANQVLYHLGERRIERHVLPFCEAHGIAIVGYSPFGQGDFPGPHSAGGQALAGIARERGATPRQVALAFLLRRPSLFAIPKSSTPEHVEENAGAALVELAEDDLRRIDEVFPCDETRPGSIPTL